MIRGLDRSPVTWPAIVILGPGIAVSDVFFNLDPAAPLPSRVLAALAGWACMAVTLLAMNRLLLTRMALGQPRRLIVLASFALAGLARVGVIQMVMGLVGGSPTPWIEGAARIVTTVVWLTAMAIVVDWERASVRELARFKGQLAILAQARNEQASELARVDALLAEARDAVRSAIIHIREDLARAHDRAAMTAVADHISATVDELVRPTSHSLARVDVTRFDVPPDSALRPSLHERAVGLMTAWPSAAPFQLAPVAALVTPLTVAAMLFHPLHPADLVGIAGVVAQFGILWAASVALYPRALHWRWPWSLAAVTAVYGLMIYVGLAAMTLAADLGAPVLPQVGLLPTVTAITVAGAAALHVQRSDAQAQAERVIAEIEWSSSRIQELTWAQRRRLGIFLHGPVQATLTASEHLIRRWLAGGDPDPNPVIAQVDEQLTRALFLDRDTPGQTWPDSQSELTLLWQSILEVTWSTSDAADAALTGDPDCRSVVLEVTRELLHNAVRHGSADTAQVDTDLVNDRVLRLTVTEINGTDSPDGGERVNRTGLGRELLDTVTLDWSTRASPGHRTTVVLFATGGEVEQSH